MKFGQPFRLRSRCRQARHLILQSGYADEDALPRIQCLVTSVPGEISRHDVAVSLNVLVTRLANSLLGR